MERQPPESTRTATLCPYTTRFRSVLTPRRLANKTTRMAKAALAACTALIRGSETFIRSRLAVTVGIILWKAATPLVSNSAWKPKVCSKYTDQVLKQIGRASCRERVGQYV